MQTRDLSTFILVYELYSLLQTLLLLLNIWKAKTTGCRNISTIPKSNLINRDGGEIYTTNKICTSPHFPGFYIALQ